MNYLLDHWQGKHSFKQSLVVNTLLPLLVLLALQHLIFEQLTLEREWLRLPLLIIMAAIYVLILLAGIVSVNRKIRISESPAYGAGYSVLACNSTLFIAGCVAVVHLIDIPTQGILTPTTAKPAFPPITLQADDNDPTLHYFSGQINPFTPQRFKDYLDRNTQLGTLVLESTGGHVYAAREIARLILQADINTRVDSYCYSSCTLIFASGTTRTAGTRAELGFHGYQYRTGSSAIYDNIESQQHKDTLIFLKQGISQTFIDHIFSAPHNQLWLPDNDELIRANFIHSVPGAE